MKKLFGIFDFDDGDFVTKLSDNMGMDMDGNLMMKVSDNLAMDLDSGDLHITSGWGSDDDDD